MDAAGIDIGDAGLVSCPWPANADTKRNTTERARVIRLASYTNHSGEGQSPDAAGVRDLYNVEEV